MVRIPHIIYFIGALKPFSLACIPGDISAQILLLQKYQKSSFDILGTLPPHLATKCLIYLPLQTLLFSAALVSQKWNALTHDQALWRVHCLELTRTDPVPVRPPPNEIAGDWEGLFKSLWCRERNWFEGRPQSIRFLNGHTGFCTTLLLKGEVVDPPPVSFCRFFNVFPFPYLLRKTID